MTVFLKDILQLPELKDIKILAGKKGLSKPIRWVNVLEMLDELDQLSEGELFVTTAIGLENDLKMQEQLVTTLVRKQLVGLAIQIGFYLQEIPESLVQLCEKNGLPLLEVPEKMSFGTLTRTVAECIIQQQNALLESTQHIQEGMTRLLLEKQGLEGIAKKLWELLGKPIQLLDSRGHSLASYSEDKEKKSVLVGQPIPEREKIRELALKHGANALFQWKKKLIYPLMNGNTYYGCIWIENRNMSTPIEMVILASAATICILEIIKKEEVWEAEERIRGDFLDDLLEGSWVQQEDVYHRGKRLGFDLEKPFVMLAIEHAVSEPAKTPIEVESESKSGFLRWLQTLLLENGRQGLIRESHEYVVLFLPLNEGESEEELFQFLTDYHQELVKNVAEVVSIGISHSKVGIASLTRALSEARSALQIGRRLKGVGYLTLYSELGPYSIFGVLEARDDIQSYYERILGPLLAYDEKHNAEFILTLRTFFEANLEIRETARRLFIHRHTLSYRLKRIEEISHLSPLVYWERIQLEVAILLLPLFEKK